MWSFVRVIRIYYNANQMRQQYEAGMVEMFQAMGLPVGRELGERRSKTKASTAFAPNEENSYFSRNDRGNARGMSRLNEFLGIT
jgi:hypothetical protein